MRTRKQPPKAGPRPGKTAVPTALSDAATDPERARIAEGTADQPGRWWSFGPYVSERAWGTVREDYSAEGRAWEYFPHDHSRSRAYRWSEDGLAGICDAEQRLCFALAFWNGRDPILKERIFGLTGNEGNHGEDAKEYWWYVDATPTASWLRWRYHYPQDTFPYDTLVSENRGRAGLGDGFTVELPTGSGRHVDLGTVADDVERRLLRLFLSDETGRRPIWASCELFQQDAAWRDELLFHEYFHGETGEGLGASHQTGWTALAAALVADRGRRVHRQNKP
jgi:hypothetical protein